MKTSAILVVTLLFCLFLYCRSGSAIRGDSFGIHGKVYNQADSTALSQVTITITGFHGHLKEPVPDVVGHSDSTGAFYVSQIAPHEEYFNLWRDEIYMADSCFAVFSKSGFINDTITLYGTDSTDTAIYLRESQ